MIDFTVPVECKAEILPSYRAWAVFYYENETMGTPERDDEFYQMAKLVAVNVSDDVFKLPRYAGFLIDSVLLYVGVDPLGICLEHVEKTLYARLEAQGVNVRELQKSWPSIKALEDLANGLQKLIAEHEQARSNN